MIVRPVALNIVKMTMLLGNLNNIPIGLDLICVQLSTTFSVSSTDLIVHVSLTTLMPMSVCYLSSILTCSRRSAQLL
jgi:hypothetical protein